MPDLYMICGPNGAGKSTWPKGIATRHNVVCIDTDALAAGGLSPRRGRLLPGWSEP